MPKIIIIGGGIAGLAAAVHLKSGAKAYGKTVDVLLLEKNNRIEVKGEQHLFTDARLALPVHLRDKVFAYVWLDPKNPPQSIMLQWHDGTWEHRAYWGADKCILEGAPNGGSSFVFTVRASSLRQRAPEAVPRAAPAKSAVS